MNGNNQDNQNNLNNGVGMDPSSLGSVSLGNTTQPNPTEATPTVNVSDTTQTVTPPTGEQQANLVQSAIENIQSSITPAEQTPTPVASAATPTPQPNPAPSVAPSTEGTTPNLEPASAPAPQPESLNPVNTANASATVASQPSNTQYSATAQSNSVLQPIPGTNPNATTNAQSTGNSNGFVEPKKEESIGTIPPEQKPKKKKGINKILFILLILVLMAGVAYGVYYYLSMGKETNNSITVDLKDVTLELNSEVPDDISSYATITGTDSKNCSVITTGIDTKKAGKYKYVVKCGDKKYEGNVTVLEDNELTIDLQEVVVSVGAENVLAENFIVADSCNKKDCKFSFVDKDKVDEYLKTAGTYEVDIKITAEDLEGTVKGSLTVINEEIKLYLVCNLESNNKITTDKYAMGSENTYIGLAYRTHEYSFKSEEDYKKAVKDKESTITYDDITGNATYNDKDKILTISNKLTEEELKTEFANEVPTAYVDFYNHYITKGYECTIER